MSNVIQFKRRVRATQQEDIAFANILGPLQTENQKRMLRMHEALCNFCYWAWSPVRRTLEYFDGGTEIFRSYPPITAKAVCCNNHNDQ